MNRLLTLIAIIALSAGSAAAAESGKCTTAAKSKWQPQAKLEEQLKSEGMTIRQIKVENGCYEVYATDKSGKRANMAFNAETLEKLDDPEAGED